MNGDMVDSELLHDGSSGVVFVAETGLGVHGYVGVDALLRAFGRVLPEGSSLVEIREAVNGALFDVKGILKHGGAVSSEGELLMRGLSGNEITDVDLRENLRVDGVVRVRGDIFNKAIGRGVVQKGMRWPNVYAFREGVGETLGVDRKVWMPTLAGEWVTNDSLAESALKAIIRRGLEKFQQESVHLWPGMVLRQFLLDMAKKQRISGDPGGVRTRDLQDESLMS